MSKREEEKGGDEGDKKSGVRPSEGGGGGNYFAGLTDRVNLDGGKPEGSSGSVKDHKEKAWGFSPNRLGRGIHLHRTGRNRSPVAERFILQNQS